MQHFSHPRPRHLLQEVYIDEEFVCDGCNSDGHGKRYCCTVCCSSFELHDRCATCPPSIALEFHAKHPLTLVNNNKACNNNCRLCGDEVNGLYYTCKQGCDFHVHPLCTELPRRVQHTLHPKHVLTLRAASGNSQCMACGGACSKELWRYQCDQCKNVDVHIECAFMQESLPPPPPPKPAKSYQKSKSPPTPMTDYQGQYPHPSSTWCHYQQPQQPPIGWYPPAPQVNHWVNGYYYHANPYYYPYPYYNVPQYAMQQYGYGHGQSSSSRKKRRIYSVVAVIAARVAIGALTGGLLS